MKEKDTNEQPEKIKPTVKQSVTVSVQVEPSFNGLYELIAIHPDGSEKAGTQFQVSVKGFDKAYKHLTAAPEGTAELPQFRVKKNPKI